MTDTKTHDAGNDIGAKEFFAKTGRQDHEKRVALEYSKFMDPGTKELRKDLKVIKRNCPVCDKNDTRTAFLKYGFPHLICKNCGMMYVSPILEQEESEPFYKTSRVYDSVMNVMMTKVQRDFDIPKFEEGIKLITKILGYRGKLLDIGCLAGHFCEIAKKEGWDCTGIELNEKAVEICKSLGLNIINKKLIKGLFPESTFDAVTLWDVLEHLDDPKDIIITINHILKKGGILLILVPNANSLAARILRERCNMFNGCSHINLFFGSNLKKLLEDSGFEVMETRTIISEFSVLNNYLNYEPPYQGKGQKINNLLGLFAEKELHDALLGYKVQMIARKI